MPPQYCRHLSATSRVRRPALSLAIEASCVTSLPDDVQLGGAVDQRAQRLDLGLQLGQREVHHLVVDHRLAEGLALRVYSMVSRTAMSRPLSAFAAPHSRSSWNCSIW